MDREAGHMSALRLIAPAKINWTLEALRIRPDGYHEIRSILQTIDLHDVVTLEDADDVSLVLTGDAGHLAGEPAERNLAYRAAIAFRARVASSRGVRITLEKRIPIAAGLGGGSSDAAAVIRGLNVLWDAGQPAINLAEIAAEIGSDPPFFTVGGTAAVSGRGERVEPLDDASAHWIVLATPPPAERGEKTAAMYAALTPDDYTEGDATIGLREIVASGHTIVDGAIANVFERVIGKMHPETANAMAALEARGLFTPHLCGSGPSFFVLVGDPDLIELAKDRITKLGFRARASRAMTRERTLEIERR
jgi:4-diphosphocytidyl-2-C-methyl-D-erythritol kinase